MSRIFFSLVVFLCFVKYSFALSAPLEQLTALTDPAVVAELKICQQQPAARERCMIERVAVLNEQLLRQWSQLSADPNPAIRQFISQISAASQAEHASIFETWLGTPAHLALAKKHTLLQQYVIALDAIGLYQTAFSQRMASLQQGKRCIGVTELPEDPSCAKTCRLSSENGADGYQCLSQEEWKNKFPDGEGTLIPADTNDAGVYNQCAGLLPQKSDWDFNGTYKQLMRPGTRSDERTAAMSRVWRPIFRAKTTNGLFNAMRWIELATLRRNAERALGTNAANYVGLEGVCTESQPLMHYWSTPAPPREQKEMISRSERLSTDASLWSLQKQATALLEQLRAHAKGQGTEFDPAVLTSILAAEPLLLAGEPFVSVEALVKSPPQRLLSVEKMTTLAALREWVRAGIAELGKQYQASLRMACDGKRPFVQLVDNTAVREALLGFFPEYASAYQCLQKVAPSREETNQTGRRFSTLGICVGMPALCTTAKLWPLLLQGTSVGRQASECSRAGSLCSHDERARLREGRRSLVVDALTLFPAPTVFRATGRAVQALRGSRAPATALQEAEKQFMTARQAFSQSTGATGPALKELADTMRKAESQAVVAAWNHRLARDIAEKQYAQALEAYRSIAAKQVAGDLAMAEHQLLIATTQNMAAQSVGSVTAAQAAIREALQVHELTYAQRLELLHRQKVLGYLQAAAE